jgi:hypothetical protein
VTNDESMDGNAEQGALLEFGRAAVLVFTEPVCSYSIAPPVTPPVE